MRWRVTIGIVVAAAFLTGILLVLLHVPSSDPASIAGERGLASPEVSAPTSPLPLPERGFPAAQRSVDAAVPNGLRSEAQDVSATDAGQSAQKGDAEARVRVEAWLDENASEADRAIDEFCAAAAKLKFPSSELPPAAERRDARVFMTGKLDMEGMPPYIGALHLPDPLVEQLRALGENWFLGIEPRHLQGVDFSWMTRLRGFDVWSAEGEAAPNFARMKWWVLLRLGRGRLQGDFGAAWADVEHFSRLLRTQGNLVAEISGYQFMELAEVARALAQQHGLSVPTNTVNYSELKQLSRAAPAFFYPRVSRATAKRALDCFQPSCGVLAEAAEMRKRLATFGTPPEVDFSPCPDIAEGGAQLEALSGADAMEFLPDDTPLRWFNL